MQPLEGHSGHPVLALSWKQALLLAIGAAAAFHLAYAVPRFGFLVVLYLYCLFQLAALPTPRKAFYFGLVIGYAVYAPHLAFFWKIFGWPAMALWTVLAFWLGVFLALARLCRKRFGRLAVVLVPCLWTGLEYFRSELYYLRFSWLNAGFAFSEAPNQFLAGTAGVYGVGFLFACIAVALTALRWQVMIIASLIALPGLTLLFNRPADHEVDRRGFSSHLTV